MGSKEGVRNEKEGKRVEREGPRGEEDLPHCCAHSSLWVKGSPMWQVLDARGRQALSSPPCTKPMGNQGAVVSRPLSLTSSQSRTFLSFKQVGLLPHPSR